LTGIRIHETLGKISEIEITTVEVKQTVRNWKKTVFVRAMPGRYEFDSSCNSVADWQAKIEEIGIKTIICLAPDTQISSVSPEYAQWRQKQKASSSSPYELIDIPIEDFGIPVSAQREPFWKVARDIARRIALADDKIFVHCSAGKERTGMFAIAVLCQMDYSLADAYEEIQKIGSYPDTPEQDTFITENCFQFDFGKLLLNIGDEISGMNSAADEILKCLPLMNLQIVG